MSEAPTRRLWPLPQGVDTALTVPELRFLQELAHDQVVVEFGTHHGASAIAMALAGAKVATVDPAMATEQGRAALHRSCTSQRVGLGNLIVPYALTSDAFMELPHISLRHGGCFIDGDHAAGQPARDVQHALELVGPGGWIALHDVSEQFPEVLAAAQSLIEAGHQEIGRVGTLRAYRR